MKAPIPADPTPMTADKATASFVLIIDGLSKRANQALHHSSAGIGVGSAFIGAFKAFCSHHFRPPT